MVKKTVNQDDPSVYHLFYADEQGSPGSDLTFFEFPGVTPGRAGDGMVHRIVSRVGSAAALDFWAERLGAEGHETTRDGDSLRFSDFEGLEHELTLQGFNGVRAYSSDPDRSRALLEEALMFEPRGDGWESRGERRGSLYA